MVGVWHVVLKSWVWYGWVWYVGLRAPKAPFQTTSYHYDPSRLGEMYGMRKKRLRLPRKCRTMVTNCHICFNTHLSSICRYRTRCPLCCFLDSHFVVSVTPFAVSVAHFVEMYSHFVDSVTHFVVSDQQSGNVYFQNVIRRPECWFSIWVESTILVLQKPRINNSCPIKPNQQIV